MIATLVWFGQNCKVAQTLNSTAQGVPIQFYVSFLEQFFLLEPVGGSAPKFSSGAIEQLKIKSSTAAALLCAAQAAPSPGFRSGGRIFFSNRRFRGISRPVCHSCECVLADCCQLYICTRCRLNWSLLQSNPATATVDGIKFLGSESLRALGLLLSAAAAQEISNPSNSWEIAPSVLAN